MIRGILSPGRTSLLETIRPLKQEGSFVEVAYLDDAPVSRTVFLEDERKLLKAIAGLLGSIIEKKRSGALIETVDQGAPSYPERRLLGSRTP
ncbi:MAG: hypothetical protein ACOC8N_02855 [Spirochaetota bacterium]